VRLSSILDVSRQIASELILRRTANGYTSDFMKSLSASQAVFERNRQFIPGGMFSLNRETDPIVIFERADGAYLWDADGNRYIDYHAAFGPYLLGHNAKDINDAVKQSIDDGASLFGANTTRLEGRLAELICRSIPFVDSVQIVNSGSEATYQAIRLSRAFTGRDHILVMQGGYNGWHNDVACNVMTPLSAVGPRQSPGEYPVIPLGAGIPEAHLGLIHVVNFNDLESVEYVCRKYPIAAILTEPILQNIGIVKPVAGYLEGLRKLADQFGAVLIFDEVKTGFRHAIGGYSTLCGVSPDLAVYGKAIANGYPVAAIGGRADLMSLFGDPDPKRRVFLAGTYNGHPVPVAAAIATLEHLEDSKNEVYARLESLGRLFAEGFESIRKDASAPLTLVRQGSAFCIYFMDHAPVDWHDIAQHHDFAADVTMRRSLIEQGVFPFPLATKQWSISTAHTEAIIEETVTALRKTLLQPVLGWARVRND
jgi:glutamate-1-semialdehyde 2,1-aminomutase